MPHASVVAEIANSNARTPFSGRVDRACTGVHNPETLAMKLLRACSLNIMKLETHVKEEHHQLPHKLTLGECYPYGIFVPPTPKFLRLA